MFHGSWTGGRDPSYGGRSLRGGRRGPPRPGGSDDCDDRTDCTGGDARPRLGHCAPAHPARPARGARSRRQPGPRPVPPPGGVPDRGDRTGLRGPPPDPHRAGGRPEPRRSGGEGGALAAPPAHPARRDHRTGRPDRPVAPHPRLPAGAHASAQRRSRAPAPDRPQHPVRHRSARRAPGRPRPHDRALGLDGRAALAPPAPGEGAGRRRDRRPRPVLPRRPAPERGVRMVLQPLGARRHPH